MGHMSGDDSSNADLERKVTELEKRLQKLEKLLDDNNHDLFEEWFKRFLDDKCFGGW